MGDLTGDNFDIVCDTCELPESEHVFTIGTRVMKNGSYICNSYSQKKLMTKKNYDDNNR